MKNSQVHSSKPAAHGEDIVLSENRRTSPRKKTPSLWATLIQDEHRLISEVRDISLGGVFLNSRFPSKNDAVKIEIAHREKNLIIDALPVRDELKPGNSGTGFQFYNLSSSAKAQLAKLLREFN